IGHRGLHAAALADAPADVEPGQVPHGERPHREAEVGQHRVDLLGRRALQDELLGLVPTLVEHPVADEAVADADQHRDLADPTAMAVAIVVLSVWAPRTFSRSRMTLAGLKKWVPITLWGRFVALAISSTSSVEVLVASTAPGRAMPSSRAKTSFLMGISSNTA